MEKNTIDFYYKIFICFVSGCFLCVCVSCIRTKSNDKLIKINQLILINQTLKPRIQYIMEDYFKYADCEGSILVINIYKNVNGYKLCLAPMHFQDILPGLEETPCGFFTQGPFTIFVYGEMPDDLFSITNIQKEFNNLVLSPNKNPLSVKNPPKQKMPIMPFYLEAKTWLYTYVKGSFVLYDIRMMAIIH